MQTGHYALSYEINGTFSTETREFETFLFLSLIWLAFIHITKYLNFHRIFDKASRFYYNIFPIIAANNLNIDSSIDSQSLSYRESLVLNCLTFRSQQNVSTERTCSVTFLFESRNMSDVESIMKSMSRLSHDPWKMRGERRQLVYDLLVEHMNQTQANMLNSLHSIGIYDYKQFWIINGISVSINISQYQQLESFDIEWIDIFLDDSPIPIEPSSNFILKSKESAFSIFNVEKAWENSINMGSKVTVAIVDYGVNYQHPYLQFSYRGCNLSNNTNISGISCSSYDHDYNWFDASFNYRNRYPKDPKDHGTGVTSRVSGYSYDQETDTFHTLGIAPKSNWISARIDVEAKPFIIYPEYLNISQWILCPFPISSNGKSGVNCSLGADIVSNSWVFALEDKRMYDGLYTCEKLFRIVSVNYEIAGTSMIFSMGNNGNIKGEYFSPLAYIDHSIITVSSVTKAGEPGGSTLGFAKYKKEHIPLVQHPVVCAPGEMILVAAGSDTLEIKSGASMAAPFVAGVIALMIGENPTLSPKDIKELIKYSSKKRLDELSGLRNLVTSLGKLGALIYGYGPIDPLGLMKYINSNSSNPNEQFIISSSRNLTELEMKRNETMEFIKEAAKSYREISIEIADIIHVVSKSNIFLSLCHGIMYLIAAELIRSLYEIHLIASITAIPIVLYILSLSGNNIISIISTLFITIIFTIIETHILHNYITR